MRQLATATGLDHSRYSGTATGPWKTGPNWSTTGKKPVQTSCDRFFFVKFIVPNKSNITSCKLHIWIDILILCRLVKVSSNFVKTWLRYGENRRWWWWIVVGGHCHWWKVVMVDLVGVVVGGRHHWWKVVMVDCCCRVLVSCRSSSWEPTLKDQCLSRSWHRHGTAKWTIGVQCQTVGGGPVGMDEVQRGAQVG